MPLGIFETFKNPLFLILMGIFPIIAGIYYWITLPSNWDFSSRMTFSLTLIIIGIPILLIGLYFWKKKGSLFYPYNELTRKS